MEQNVDGNDACDERYKKKKVQKVFQLVNERYVYPRWFLLSGFLDIILRRSHSHVYEYNLLVFSHGRLILMGLVYG